MVKKAAVGLILILIVVAACANRSHPPEAALALQTPHVQGVLVRQAPVQTAQTVSGQAEAYRSATVASEVAGRVLRRPRLGAAVRQGDVLVLVDTAMAQTEVDEAAASAAHAWAACRQADIEYRKAEVDTAAGQRQAEAQLTSAQATDARLQAGSRPQELKSAQAALDQATADQTLAESDLARYRQLLAEGAIPAQTWDQAQDRLTTARSRHQQAEEALSMAREGPRREDRMSSHAQVQAAQASLDMASTRDLRLATLQEQVDGLRSQAVASDAALRQARIALERHHIRAPFTGRVLATPAEVGELVVAGSPVVRIGEVRRIKATFQVPEKTRQSLHVGEQLRVQMYPARILTLGYQADPRTRTFPIEMALDNPTQALLPGTVLELEIQAPPESRLLIPMTCVGTDGDVPYVYVLAQGHASRRPVHLGAPVGADVVVTEGLRVGEEVASNPQPLTDGAAVAP